MKPQHAKKPARTYRNHPTSPWTEAYQSALTWTDEHDQSMPAREDNNSETQAPTHDALSEIYNRGY